MTYIKRILLAAACFALCGTVHAKEARQFTSGLLPTSLMVFDIDTNGELSFEESIAVEDYREGLIESRIEDHDIDSDGWLSIEESIQAQESIQNHIIETRMGHFDAADINGDGVLDFSEFIDLEAIQNMYTEGPEDVTGVFVDFLDEDGEQVDIDSFLDAIQGDEEAEGEGELDIEEAFELPDFKDLFGEATGVVDGEIPQEILDLLEGELPEDIEIIEVGEGEDFDFGEFEEIIADFLEGGLSEEDVIDMDGRRLRR